MDKIDVVIAYVDCSDKAWQHEYSKHVAIPYNPVRFRSWDTVRYILRGIDTHMPWVNNIYLIVMSETQVPEYVDTSKVKIVYHKDFMPESQLPCFSSNPIEAYIWNIPGLSEKFIYFNDDMIPIMGSDPDDFFTDDGRVRCTQRINHNPEIKNIFHQIRKNCTEIAFRAAGLSYNGTDVISQRHGPQALLRSYCEECFDKAQDEIEGGLTMVRASSNICQYVYTNYMLLKRMTDRSEKPASLTYADFKKCTVEQVADAIINPSEKFICINDTSDVGDHYEEYRATITASFETLYPNKSKYEK